MEKVLHRADTRGYFNHGWLKTSHTFSFASYRDTQRMHFGVLRVLNDDEIDGGKGFGMHPHDNMEIITIPLKGELAHKDSMGNSSVIHSGDVQVMSAGTGVYHSEYNNLPDEKVELLQIWVFPNKKDVSPRYGQISVSGLEKPDEFYQILSPDPDGQGVWIHQNAWFSLGRFSKDTNSAYKMHSKENGLYIFVIEGELQIEDIRLKKRDGMGIRDLENAEMKISENSYVLLMEIPMKL